MKRFHFLAALLFTVVALPSCIFEEDVQATINDYLTRNYPGVVIVDETELVTICIGAAYELEVEDTSGAEIDLIFDTDGVFLYEAREIETSALPAEVTNSIAANYADYTIDEDDVEQFIYAVGLNRYEVELEKDGEEIDVVFKNDGEVECEGTDDD